MEKKKIKEFKIRDENGKYIPKTSKKNLELETFIEDGVFSSNVLQLLQNEKPESKGKRDRKSKGYESSVTNFLFHGNNYNFQNLIEIKNLIFNQCTFPVENVKNVSALQLTIQEPLIITEENQFVESLLLMLPKTFTMITKVAYPNDNLKNKSITIYTEETHFIPMYSDIQLLCNSDSIYSNYIFQVIAVEQKSITCIPKLERNSKKGIQEKLFIPNTFLPTSIYLQPPVSKKQIATLVQKQLTAIKDNRIVEWNEENQVYKINDTNENKYLFTYLIEKEVHTFRNRTIARVPSLYSNLDIQTIGGKIQRSLGLVHIEKGKHSFQILYNGKFNLFELNTVNCKPHVLVEIITEMINTGLGLVDEIEKVFGNYDYETGIFSFYKCSGEFSIDFSETLANLLGFEIKNRGLKRYFGSPIYYVHGDNYQCEETLNYYQCRYLEKSKQIQLFASGTRLHSSKISLPFEILDSPIEKILGFKKCSESVYITNDLTSFNFPKSIYLIVEQLESDTVIDVQNKTKNCFGILKREHQNYELSIPFESRKGTFNIEKLSLQFITENNVILPLTQDLFSIVQITA